MTKTKSTKRALLLSGLTLLVCVSMLIGSTFAWFTDSVTSSGNIIKSGKLDVEMFWKDAGTNVAQATYKDASEGAIFNYEKWEPGYVDAKHIKIENVGTLAFKYLVLIDATGTVSELANVIDVYFAEGELAISRGLTELTRVGTLNEVLSGMPANMSGDLLEGQNDVVTIALKMQETAGNEYQEKSIGSSFAVKLFATQLASEKDSFDENYDVDSEYAASVANAADLVDAVKDGGNIALANDIIVSESLPITKDTVLDLNGKNIGTSGSTTGCPLYLKGGKLTVKNGTLDLDGSETNVNGTFSVAIGYDAQTELVVENVNFTGKTAINGTFATDGPLKVTVSDCTMDVTSVGIAVSANSTDAVATITNCNIDADEYAIFASQGSKITINGGTYKSAGKVITSMYDNTVVTINGGTFDGELWVTNGGSLVIYGGTFTADPSAYVATGYQAVNNGDGTWTVKVL